MFKKIFSILLKVILVLHFIYTAYFMTTIQIKYNALRYFSIREFSIIETGLEKMQQNVNILFRDLSNNIEKKPSFEKLQKANIRIKIGNCGGSGTIIKIDEKYFYILTAKHVAETNEVMTIEIPLKDKNYTEEDYFIKHYEKGNKYITVPAKERFLHKDYDVALVRIPIVLDNDISSLSVSQIVPLIGDTIYIIGNPIHMKDNISKGIYSSDKVYDGVEMMVVSGGVIFGNSGGAVTNAEGDLLGVVSAVSYLPFQKATIYIYHLGIIIPYHIVVDFLKDGYGYFSLRVGN